MFFYNVAAENGLKCSVLSEIQLLHPERDRPGECGSSGGLLAGQHSGNGTQPPEEPEHTIGAAG